MSKRVTSWLKCVWQLWMGIIGLALLTACATSPLPAPPTRPTPSPLPTADWSSKYAPAPRHLPKLKIENSDQSAPAGSDVTYLFKSDAVTYYREYRFGIQGLPAGITATLFQSGVPWEGELTLHTPATLPPDLYTAQVSVYTTDYHITVIKPISLVVTACSESLSGHFIQRLDVIPKELWLNDSMDIARQGIVVPIQICGSQPARHMTVTLGPIYSGSEVIPAATMPRHLYRSRVYPAPRMIRLHHLPLTGRNVSLVAETKTDLQLSADVTAGLYLLVFEIDALRSHPDSTFAYDLELTP